MDEPFLEQELEMDLQGLARNRSLGVRVAPNAMRRETDVFELMREPQFVQERESHRVAEGGKGFAEGEVVDRGFPSRVGHGVVKWATAHIGAEEGGPFEGRQKSFGAVC